MFPETQNGPQLDDLFYRYADIVEDAGMPVSPGDLAARTTFFQTIASLAMPDQPLIEWLERLDAGLNLESCLDASKTHPDDLTDWSTIKSRCKDGETLAGFSLDDFARCGGRPDTVTLTTLHSSKGLEYEVVIMPGLEEGRIPGYAAKSAGALAEARRVFYVGMTRAKDAIYMLYSGCYKDRYGRIWENGPSRFVHELQTNLPPSI